MKLIEIANNLNKTSSNEDWFSTEKIGEELGIDIPYMDQQRLKCYWVGHWNCTDTYVGYRMYFLDDEPVAFSEQSGRKSDEVFHWFSLKTAAKVRDYLLSLLYENEDDIDIRVCDINEEIGNGFKINYNSEIINTDYATLNGEKVLLIERIKNKPYGMDTMQKIQLPNGEIKQVEVNELEFGFHIINKQISN